MPYPRVLITGATGFVGAQVADLFCSRKIPTRALVRSSSDTRHLNALDVELRVGGLDDPTALRAAVENVAVVLHLAAATRARNDAEFARVNASGTRALLDAMLAANPAPRRLVYLSSLAAVGPSERGQPVDQATPPRPLTAYGRSKLAGERICQEAAERLEVFVLRAPAVYGPRDRDLYHFFRLARRGILPVPSGAARPLQLIHVADLAAALAQAIQVPGDGGLYHVAEARHYTWPEVAQLVADAVGRRARFVRVPAGLVVAAATISEWTGRLTGQSTIFSRDKARELLAPGWLCETAMAREDLGFTARIPLAQGLAETAHWYSDNGWL